MFNVDIRDAIRSNGLYGYQVAEMIGMTETSFSRLLARKELSPERKKQIFDAIGLEYAMKKKVNPRRIPVSAADLKRAKNMASDKGVKLAIAIFLTVLCDDFGFSKEQVQYAWKRLNKLSEEIGEGRISTRDLLMVLKDEYGIELSM